MKKITSIFIMITTLVLALSVSANAAVEIKLGTDARGRSNQRRRL